MTTTLPNGTRVPDVASTSWAGDLEVNWQLLDAAIGAIGSNVQTNRPNTWTAEQTFSEPIIGNLTGTASKAGADEDGTSIKTGYVNVAGTQTVTGNKEFTGSNTFNSILPNATNTYSLGSSTYQWSSVYAQTYYYNGTAWGLDKANVWTGNNQFNKSIDPSSIASVDDPTMSFFGQKNVIFFNTRGSSNYKSYGTFLYAGYGTGGVPERFGQLKLLRSTDKYGDTNDGLVPDTSFNLWRVALEYSTMEFMENVKIANDGSVNYLCPITTSVTDLGTSTNKWKTLNGINPGILNHVDASVTPVDIDTTGWVLDGSAWNTFNTSSYIDGWLYLSYMQCAVDDYVSVRLGSTNYLKPTLLFKAEKLVDNRYYIYATIPVTKKFNIYLEIKTSGTLVSHCLYPSIGNV